LSVLALSLHVLLFGSRGLSPAWSMLTTPVTHAAQSGGAETPHNIPELRPNPGPEALPPGPPWKQWLAATLLGLILASAVAVAYQASRRRGQVRPPAPQETALAELARIDNREMRSSEDVQQYHDLVSGVLRRYLQARFQLPTLERTTQEFFESLQRINCFSPMQKSALIEFLREADLVKFARSCPPPEQTRTFGGRARQLILDTAGIENHAK
jgi:hypothetical protein